jgi:hypothetical protein
MPPPTSSLKPGPLGIKSNGKKSPAPATNGNGSSTPKESGEAEERKVVSKPDQNAYNTEQDGYNKEIADIKTKLVCLGLVSTLPVLTYFTS